MIPAHLFWLNERVTLLLNRQTSKRNMSDVEAKNEIRDFIEVFHKYPAHVVDEAFRWWGSAKNPDSKWYPDTGILERKVLEIMNPISIAKTKIMNFDYEARRKAKADEDWIKIKAANAREAERAEQKEKAHQLAVLNGTHKRQLPKGVAAQLKYLNAAADEARGKNQPVSSEIKNRINAFYEKHPDLDPNLAPKGGKSASVSRSQEDLGEGCPKTLKGRTQPNTKGHIKGALKKVVKKARDAREKT